MKSAQQIALDKAAADKLAAEFALKNILKERQIVLEKAKYDELFKGMSLDDMRKLVSRFQSEPNLNIDTITKIVSAEFPRQSPKGFPTSVKVSPPSSPPKRSQIAASTPPSLQMDYPPSPAAVEPQGESDEQRVKRVDLAHQIKVIEMTKIIMKIVSTWKQRDNLSDIDARILKLSEAVLAGYPANINLAEYAATNNKNFNVLYEEHLNKLKEFVVLGTTLYGQQTQSNQEPGFFASFFSSSKKDPKTDPLLSFYNTLLETQALLSNPRYNKDEKLLNYILAREVQVKDLQKKIDKLSSDFLPKVTQTMQPKP